MDWVAALGCPHVVRDGSWTVLAIGGGVYKHTLDGSPGCIIEENGEFVITHPSFINNFVFYKLDDVRTVFELAYHTR